MNITSKNISTVIIIIIHIFLEIVRLLLFSLEYFYLQKRTYRNMKSHILSSKLNATKDQCKLNQEPFSVLSS